MILLFTDFGPGSSYVGQMHAVVARAAPDVRCIDLAHDVVPFRPDLAAYLLAAHSDAVLPGDVVVGVVDPGVGGGRAPVVLEVDGRYFVGPDNGLFELVRRRAGASRCWRITWTPPVLSDSFHGRDLFAPVAARIAQGDPVPGEPGALSVGSDWPDDLAAVVHVDHYGNAVTGLRAEVLPGDAHIDAAGRRLTRRRTFGDVARGEAFFYANANGLVEIAVNGGRADTALGLTPGSAVAVVDA